MVKATDMTDILHIEAPDVDMTPPYSDRSATEIIEQELRDEEQIERAYNLFQRLLIEGKKKEATKIYWFALLNYQVDFSND